ncbi:6-carboxytetrahydropterin synthase [Candidatus Dojkabacteria bacterium]|nr:6-carboxytetrahydropterin synthase [Candidatus Dojkabacteria bacterium]
MDFEIIREFDFSAAHSLPKYNGKCKNFHGHNYILEVYVRVDVADMKDGIGIDTAEIKNIVNETVIDVLDHSNLNDIMENPSMENICIWIHAQIAKRINTKGRLSKLRLWETGRNSIIMNCV